MKYLSSKNKRKNHKTQNTKHSAKQAHSEKTELLEKQKHCEDEEDEDEEDEYDSIKGIIKNPRTAAEREHNVCLRVMYEYKLEYAKREKCLKAGILFILISGAVFLALMFSLDSKAFFLIMWIIFILGSITVITRIDYRCWKLERILGIKHTEKEDDVQKFKNDVIQKTDDVKKEVRRKNEDVRQKTNDIKQRIETISQPVGEKLKR